MGPGSFEKQLGDRQRIRGQPQRPGTSHAPLIGPQSVCGGKAGSASGMGLYLASRRPEAVLCPAGRTFCVSSGRGEVKVRLFGAYKGPRDREYSQGRSMTEFSSFLLSYEIAFVLVSC